MTTAVAALQKAVDSGDVDAAKAAYALARPFYEKVESDVDGFLLPGTGPTDNTGNLDYLIDMRASNLDPAVGWHGFHAVERDLWTTGITANTRAQAAELTANVTKLAALAKGLTYKPEDLANGAADLLDEVQANKITGEEELYSHLDIVDFAANVEGAQQAFAYLRPGLTKIDAGLTKQVAAQFDKVNAALDAYRDPGQAGGYKVYDAATRAADAGQLSRLVQSLQTPSPRSPRRSPPRDVERSRPVLRPVPPRAAPRGGRRRSRRRRRGGRRGMAIANAVQNHDEEVIDLTRSFPFYDQAHQAGIQTPPQRYTVFMTFDLASDARQDLQVLLARWSGAIAQVMAGRTVGAVEPARPDAVAPDTGEALDLAPAGLTVTVGLGPGVFDERFGLGDRRPRHLRPLPDLPSDRLQSGISGGDLSVQACADDPQVAYHAVRDLARMAQPTASTRWTVLGFGRASAGTGQKTPRNLLGFKDGTRNITDDPDFERFVWARDDEPGWARGGSYQVVRKIQMNIENWDSDEIRDQQRVFGRGKVEGQPLTGHAEHDTPDFGKKDAAGELVISDTSHVALAAHENNGG
nr:Dyp-type peroxidase [Pseudolysinimonas kribbensis]